MKRLTWRLGNGEIECNEAKDDCFARHEEGRRGCWECPLFYKILKKLAEYEDEIESQNDLED